MAGGPWLARALIDSKLLFGGAILFSLWSGISLIELNCKTSGMARTGSQRGSSSEISESMSISGIGDKFVRYDDAEWMGSDGGCMWVSWRNKFYAQWKMKAQQNASL